MFLQFKRLIDDRAVFVRASSITTFVQDDDGGVALYIGDESDFPIQVRCNAAQLIDALNAEIRVV